MSDDSERTKVGEGDRTKVDDPDFEGHKVNEGGRYDEGDDVDPGKVDDERTKADSDDFEGHQLKVTDIVVDKSSDI